MDQQAVFEEVRNIIVDVVDVNDAASITESTVAEDIEGWDSVQHVRILMAIERKFKFRFSNDEIEKLKNVGELVKVVLVHTKSSN